MANHQDATTLKELVVSFRTDRQMAEALKQVSARERMSVADVIRQSLLKTMRDLGLL